MKLISKEKFIRIMDNVKNTLQFQDSFGSLLSNCNVSGYFVFPSCIDDLVDTLSLLFNDKDEWISYFVFDLDCGDKYCYGCAVREDGSDIVLITAGDLYDFLIENMEKDEE